MATVSNQGDFNRELAKNINGNNLNGARAVIMNEIARIIVDDKKAFVSLLNQSGIPTSNDASTAELISKYINNIANNKKLMLGTSLLTQSKNATSSADGISNKDVKIGYEVMKSCFDSTYSNAIDPVTAIAEAVGKSTEATGKIVTTLAQGKQQKRALANQGIEIAQQKKKAQNELLQSVLAYKTAKAQTKTEEKDSGKKNNTTLYIVGGVLLVGIILTVVLIKKRTNG